MSVTGDLHFEQMIKVKSISFAIRLESGQGSDSLTASRAMAISIQDPIICGVNFIAKIKALLREGLNCYRANIKELEEFVGSLEKTEVGLGQRLQDCSFLKRSKTRVCEDGIVNLTKRSQRGNNKN